jgi:hypothetical protein
VVGEEAGDPRGSAAIAALARLISAASAGKVPVYRRVPAAAAVVVTWFSLASYSCFTACSARATVGNGIGPDAH